MLQETITLLLLFFICLLQTQETTAAAIDTNSEKIHTAQYLEHIPPGRKTKSFRNYNKEYKLYYLKKLAENFYKYKNTKKFNYLISKSWGAGGMPFNVLYTPNSHQQKVLTTIPKIRFKSNEQNVYGLMLDGRKMEKSGLKAKEKILKKHLTQRKYYSPIPQFFVSYGW